MTEHRDEKGRLAMAQSAIAKRLRKKGGVITDKTQKWRVAVRGQMAVDATKLRKKYHTPDKWERRRLAMKPGAQFDSKGNLSNYEEMKRRHG